MDFQFNNRAPLQSTRVKTEEGYLDLNAVIYRSGLFEFSPSELPEDIIPEELKGKSKIVLNVRDESVKDPEFLNSASFKPITVGHPSEFLNVETARYVQHATEHPSTETSFPTK